MASLFADTELDAVTIDTDAGQAPTSLTATATITASWDYVGPNGGYLASILWRAILGVVDQPLNPVSFQCQYLSPASEGRADVQARVIARGKRTIACQAELVVNGNTVAVAYARFAASRDGLLISDPHWTQPVVPAPQRLRPVLELVPGAASAPLLRNIDLRIVSDEAEWPIRRQVRPYYLAWARFEEEPSHTDRLVDAMRALVLADSLVWPAAERGYRGQPTHAARSSDLSVSFVDTRALTPWTLCETTAIAARDGVITGSVRLWSERGALIAVALTNMYGGPRLDGAT